MLLRNPVPKRQFVPANKKWEEPVHRAFVRYIRTTYPDILFRTDGAGLRLTKSQAGIYKSLNATSGWPDIFVAKPSRIYAGLYVEIKKDHTAIYVSRGPNKGELVADEHIRNQARVLRLLNEAGYFARFGVGLEQCKRILDWYMCKEKEPDNAELF